MTDEKEEIMEEIEVLTKKVRNEVDVDVFKHLYILFKERAITESEALQNDLTEAYWEGIADKIKAGELVVILIRGEVRTGKSTVGAKNKYEINKLIHRLGLRRIKADEYRTIMADQTEFVRFIKVDESQICIMIDEYNTMAEGGANASTEQQILQTYGDVFASRYVHRVSCNPTQMTDSNAFIHLEVIGRKKWGYYKLVGQKKEEKEVFLGREKKYKKEKGAYEDGGYTRCKLIYCNTIENDKQVLGYVDIYVEDIIKNWNDNVRYLFEEKREIEWTEAERKLVDEWKDKDWYVKYMVKKKKRQNLLIREGIRDIRELEFSTVVLGVYKELHGLAEVNKLKQEVILATIKDVCRREQKIYSMYAELDVMAKAKSLLGLLTEMANMEKALRKPKLKPKDRSDLTVALKKINEIFKRRLHEEARLCKLYEEYLTIEE